MGFKGWCKTENMEEGANAYYYVGAFSHASKIFQPITAQYRILTH